MLVPPPARTVVEERASIVEELWITYIDRETPPSAKVASLDKLAKIAGAYAPIKVETDKAKFMSLSDFYASVQE